MRFFSIDPESISELPNFNKEILECNDGQFFLTSEFLRPYCVAYLDQCFLKAREQKDVLLLPMHRKIHKYLDQCGFEFLYGNCPDVEEFVDDHIIKIKRFSSEEDKESEETTEWIKKEIFPYIEIKNLVLKKKIVENIWEIIQNGIIHSNSNTGISCCGQIYPKRRYFEVAFYDAGVGIANKIKEYLGQMRNLEDSEYIEWALGKGNTTLNQANAGLGLYFLREFLKINQGNFQIISGKGFLGHINSQAEEKSNLGNFLNGTLVNIRINISESML
jgi:hypothetical protein